MRTEVIWLLIIYIGKSLTTKYSKNVCVYFNLTMNDVPQSHDVQVPPLRNVNIVLFVMACSVPDHAGATNHGNLDYYDILVIGKTGMGKSTTSDKLTIANPGRINYIGEQHCEEVKQDSRLLMSDLSIWVIAEREKDHCIRRLKNLVMFRGLSEPHREVNDFYNTSTDQTSKPQLISNESTMVRVLDVPGFFGSSFESGLETTAKNVTTAGLGIMREILQIQATMQMKFKRIVYFLPERGPLERAHKVLQMELEVMVHYFGKLIFDCMILIATVSPDVYKYIPPDTTPFSDDARRKTEHFFHETLSRILPIDECPSKDKPPIVFISMHDTCEDILRKIKDAPVITDGITLKFHFQLNSKL